jgi:hypothetical protein
MKQNMRGNELTVPWIESLIGGMFNIFYIFFVEAAFVGDPRKWALYSAPSSSEKEIKHISSVCPSPFVIVQTTTEATHVFLRLPDEGEECENPIKSRGQCHLTRWAHHAYGISKMDSASLFAEIQTQSHSQLSSTVSPETRASMAAKFLADGSRNMSSEELAKYAQSRRPSAKMLVKRNSRGVVDYLWVSPSPSDFYGESHRR